VKRGRPAAGKETVSIAALKRELKRRESELKRLVRQEKSLRSKLAAIEKKKAALTGETPSVEATGKKRRVAKRASRAAGPLDGVPRRRGRKPGVARKKTAKSAVRRQSGPSIAALMLEVAKERPKGVTPAELADGLLKRGVKTKSKNFKKMIAIAVTRHPGLKRIKQGVYTVKG
jgi:uncharacterized protein YhaN